MDAKLREIARRYTTISAQQQVDRFLDDGNPEGALEYLTHLFNVAWDSDEEADEAVLNRFWDELKVLQ